jgi:hypothetical protein
VEILNGVAGGKKRGKIRCSGRFGVKWIALVLERR